MLNLKCLIRADYCIRHSGLHNIACTVSSIEEVPALRVCPREETDYRFEIILYPHRIFQMFEFAASGGALSQKRLHQKRSLFSNCLVVVGGKFKHHKFLENVKFEETLNIVSILVEIIFLTKIKFALLI